ncbi:hypothetical protein B0H34DRAFT_648389 [Crassisporium funariophilum]|nr:hypothetical protein B0H34DRAFT_648389 [Crassisporium funariophilum]
MATDTALPVDPPSSANLVNFGDGPFITFPPFPKAPDGVVIIPFKEFKEGGICMEASATDAEVDSMGIPTVPIRSRHKTDECKTNTKRKRKAEAVAQGKKGGLSVKKPWWEQWEEIESIRFSTGVDPHTSRFEKIYAAAADFTGGRVWPTTFASESGPKFIWDKFLRYIGLPEGGPLPQEAAKKKQEHELSDDNIPDVGEDGEDAATTRPEAHILADTGEKKNLTNEEKLRLFFSDPEKSIKIFMSSYSRSMGYIWAEANLDCIPRILAFFVNFLLRSKVLPDIERPLRRSLDFIALASTELPNSAAIAKNLPDKFSLACNSCWGKKADGYKTLVLDDIPEVKDFSQVNDIPEGNDVPEITDSAALQGLDDIVPDEPQPKRQRLETQGGPDSGPSWDSSLEAGDSWGSSGNNGWGGTDTPPNDTFDINEWGDSTFPDDPPEENPWAILLEVSQPDSLLSLLGPTALPLTHSTGIVERSMRRIKSITLPSPNIPKSPPLGDGALEPVADAVELELERHFAKIVLVPMVDWDGGDAPVYTRPAILQTSQGAVVNGSDVQAAPEGGLKAHDPLNDEITWLIENVPARVELFREGMGIAGTWVQVARQGEPAKKKKKGKSKSKKAATFWYLDEMTVITPSFWTV